MKKQIKKIGVLQTSKTVAVLYLVISAIIFEPLALMAFFVRAQGINSSAAAGAGKQMSPFFLMALPVFYCIISFVFTALAGWLYNVIAARIGGVEIEFDQE